MYTSFIARKNSSNWPIGEEIDLDLDQGDPDSNSKESS